MRWRKIFLRMPPVGQTSLASSAQDSDVRTKHLLSIPFTRHPLLLRLAVPCHERAPLTLPRRALASTCSHVPEPSQPSLSSAGIKGPYALASCPPPRCLSSAGKPPRRSTPLFVCRSPRSSPSHYLPFPPSRSWSFAKPQSYFPTHQNSTFDAGELSHQ
jgi:hypothetical protein